MTSDNQRTLSRRLEIADRPERNPGRPPAGRPRPRRPREGDAALDLEPAAAARRRRPGRKRCSKSRSSLQKFFPDDDGPRAGWTPAPKRRWPTATTCTGGNNHGEASRPQAPGGDQAAKSPGQGKGICPADRPVLRRPPDRAWCRDRSGQPDGTLAPVRAGTRSLDSAHVS